jgi:heptosyltransferase II
VVPGSGDILREGGPGAMPPDAVWVRLPRFIGDSLMIHQALEPLRDKGIPLVAWGPAPVTELFRDSGAFAAVWPDGPERNRAFALRRILKESRAAAVLNLPRSVRALVAAWLARVPLRAGWSEGGGRLLATASLPFRGEGHQLDRYRRLVERAFPGLQPRWPQPFLPRAEAREVARGLLQSAGVEAPFLGLALGAMSGNKRLGTPVWCGLIRELRTRGVAHVLLGGPGADEEQAREILAELPGVPDLTGRTPLSVAAAVLASAQGAVGNDSALSHLAAACGTPVAVAFGPTRPSATAPRGAKVAVLRREDLDCLECGGFHCRVPGHPCMQALPVALILEALAGFGALETRP